MDEIAHSNPTLRGIQNNYNGALNQLGVYIFAMFTEVDVLAI